METSEVALGFAGFSCPQQPMDETLLSSLAVKYGSCMLELLGEKFAQILPPDVCGLLRDLAARNPGFEVAWSPAVGLCLRAIRSGSDPEAKVAVAQTLLHTYANSDLSGSWELKLDSPGNLLWRSWCLPVCDYIAMDSNDRSAILRVRCNGQDRTITFFRSKNSLGWETQDLKLLPMIPFGCNAMILLSADTMIGGPFRELSTRILAEIGDRQIQPLIECEKLLRETIPLYHDWICRVLRYLVIVHSDGLFLRSGSGQSYWGYIYISENRNILSLAEMLIHEASHQYFDLLAMLEPPIAPGDEQMYYSPFVNTIRRLDQILMAYHAFGNVCLFYQSYLSCSNIQGRPATYLKTVLAQVKAIEPFIVENPALTSTGQALARPLTEALRNVG